MSFEEELKVKTERIEGILNEALPEPKENEQARLIEAMRYSVLSGGKRLRPLLMEEAVKLFKGNPETAEPFMAAIEFIHSYSLIHDDLPAMDNDEYRRGRKTTHVVYGEDIAILAGDALLNYAFEMIAKAIVYNPSSESAWAFKVLSEKAGAFGMVGGQCVDVLNDNSGDPLDMDELLFIHENKTAALIEAALMCGAILAGANEEEVSHMEAVGSKVGLAFQIRDDILDVTGSDSELGKPVGSDEKNKKTTYVSLVGVEKASQKVGELSAEAIKILSSFKDRNEFLEQLLKNLIHRRR